jgi:hypothetical protein
MALNWRTLNAIPYLRDYAAASKREAETKPIRGDKDELKPLGRREQKYRHIKRMSDNSIALFDGWQVTDTPRIQFFEGGDIHVYSEPYFQKATSNEVITEVMGARVFTEGHKAWIHYDGGVAPLYSAPSRRNPNAEVVPSIFRHNENGRLVYINPPALSTHVVNRKGAKAVRTRYMKALTYIEALAKLRRDDRPLWAEIERAFTGRFDPSDTHWQHSSKLPDVQGRWFSRAAAVEIVELMRSEDLNDHYKAYLWLQRGAAVGATMTNADKVLAWVHRYEWFTRREAIVGKKVHDRYAWAFTD